MVWTGTDANRTEREPFWIDCSASTETVNGPVAGTRSGRLGLSALSTSWPLTSISHVGVCALVTVALNANTSSAKTSAAAAAIGPSTALERRAIRRE